MKIFLIGWNTANNDFVGAAAKLAEAGHQILYWTGSDDAENPPDYRKKFSQTIFQKRSDALAGRPAKELAKENFEPIGEDFIANFYETESILLAMKQYEKLNKGALEKKNLFHNWLEYWRGAINKLKPEAIIFGVWPHAGYNYVIYKLAKFLKIKTVVFEYTRLSDRMLLINDITVGSLALKEEMRKNKNRVFSLEDLSPDIRESFERQINKKTDVTPPDIKMLNLRFFGKNLVTIKAKMVARSVLDFTIFKKVYGKFKSGFQANLKKEYEKLQIRPDFNKKYVYAALHYQPECSTSPMGGAFVDQILMVKILSACLPEDWVIYVKEHPFQWLPRGLKYFNYRYRGYYESLAKIKNVYLTPIKTGTIELIEKSRLVATVGGTVGWEAIIRNKPALYFGSSWYRDCPGAFKASEVESCRRAMEAVSGGYKVNQSEVINYLYCLDKVSFHAYFEDWVKELSKLRGAEHSQSIFNALDKEIGR